MENISQPQNLPETPHRHLPKFISLVILILLAGGTALGGLWYWQTTQIEEDLNAPMFTPRAEGFYYQDDQYGFEIMLTESWEEYTVLSSQWEGRDIENGKVTIEHGPLITLRHPQWTTANPREDMPVMVFTLVQWAEVINETMSVGVAPIPPSVLGHNSTYILTLPARYNYDFKTGWEEVDRLVHTLKAYEPKIAGQFCGGIANIQCQGGYTCKIEGTYPDAGGTCIKESQVCIQVITTAKNLKTGQTKDFPTPCDVPEGWVKI